MPQLPDICQRDTSISWGLKKSNIRSIIESRNPNAFSIGGGTVEDRRYCCIDLKSYYASVECVDRGLDPLATNLVVADESRSDGTICLAVSI